MTQPIKTLTTKVDNLHSNPRAHLVKGKNRQSHMHMHSAKL